MFMQIQTKFAKIIHMRNIRLKIRCNININSLLNEVLEEDVCGDVAGLVIEEVNEMPGGVAVIKTQIR